MVCRYQGHQSVSYVFIAMFMSPQQLFLLIFIYQSGKKGWWQAGQSQGASAHQGREREIGKKRCIDKSESNNNSRCMYVCIDGCVCVCVCMDRGG